MTYSVRPLLHYTIYSEKENHPSIVIIKTFGTKGQFKIPWLAITEKCCQNYLNILLISVLYLVSFVK